MIISTEAKATRPVRLDLAIADHDRLERNARKYGLTKSSYVRMALFERFAVDEGKEPGKR